MTVDVGRGGIGFLAPMALAGGEILEVEVAAGADGPLRMVVQVVWCCPDPRMGYRCGARLRTISVRDALRLRRQLEPRAEGLRLAS